MFLWFRAWMGKQQYNNRETKAPRSVEWQFRTEVSGQITGIIFKGQEAMRWGYMSGTVVNSKFYFLNLLSVYYEVSASEFLFF